MSFCIITSSFRYNICAFSKIFGSHSERELKRIYPIADKVESYKEAMGKLSDEELKDKTCLLYTSLWGCMPSYGIITFDKEHDVMKLDVDYI